MVKHTDAFIHGVHLPIHSTAIGSYFQRFLFTKHYPLNSRSIRSISCPTSYIFQRRDFDTGNLHRKLGPWDGIMMELPTINQSPKWLTLTKIAVSPKMSLTLPS